MKEEFHVNQESDLLNPHLAHTILNIYITLYNTTNLYIFFHVIEHSIHISNQCNMMQ